MSTPGQQPAPPPVSPPAPPPRPRTTSVVGPVVLTSVGAVLLVATLVLTLVLVGGFVGLVRNDVVTVDGRPTDAVLAVADAPGTAVVELTADERYAVHVVAPRGASTRDARPALVDDVLLLAPSGRVVAADRAPGVSSSATVGDLTVTSTGAFRAPETGTYRMAVPSADVAGAWVALTPDQPFAPFFAGVMGTVLGVFVVIGLGSVGLGLVVGGAVWWVVRVRARRATTAP